MTQLVFSGVRQFRDAFPVWVLGRCVEFTLQAFLYVIVNEVLNAVGRFVEVIVREFEVFGHIRLPETVSTYQGLGTFPAAVSENEFTRRLPCD